MKKDLSKRNEYFIYHEQLMKRQVVAVLILEEEEAMEEDEMLMERYCQVRKCEHELYCSRKSEGVFQILIRGHLLDDEVKFKSYFRFTKEEFFNLLSLIEGDISSEAYNRIKKSISAAEKLALTLRSTSVSNMLFLSIALLYEVLYLIFQFIYTTLESWYLTIFPPKMKSLAGEIILVTGAGHGIGRETCFLYAEQNAVLVIWDIDKEGIEETKKLLNDKGFYKVHTYKVDVSNRKEVLSVAEKVRSEVGDVTVLVNNAGILPCRPLKDHSQELIEKIFGVNVFSHFWTLEAFLPKMVEKNHGHVVAMSSFCGILGLANAVPYCASKFAVRGLMEALYEEMRVTIDKKSQIKFTTVYPIMVNTGLVKNPRNRFPFLLDVQTPQKVAAIIVKAIRRNYKEISIPIPMLTIDRLSRLIPAKFNNYVRDFLDTGLDPDN